MKPEPLTKEKIWKTKEFHNIDIGESKKDFNIVLLDAVKSAVEQLLNKLDEKREEISKLENIGDRNISLLWLDWFEELVKKAFSGVVK